MPDPATYPSSSPIGFNNTGQIFGVALRSARSNYLSYLTDTDCLVWTGTQFVDLIPSITVRTCTPYAINGADPKSGAYTVVGSFTDIHHPAANIGFHGVDYSTDAFSDSVSAAGASNLLKYYDHFPAALYGVNASGATIGYSRFNDQPVQILLSEAFTSTSPETLSLLNPACFTATSGCLSPIQLYGRLLGGKPTGQCGFGGCTVNDAGLFLGYDYLTSQYATYKTGAAPATTELPLNIVADGAVAFNDANQIAYYAPSDSARDTTESVVYSLTTSTETVIPPVAGTSCKNYYPISMNDLGEVVGFTTVCSARTFYWTWDPVHGTRDLNTELPAGAPRIQAFGVNDKGQILVSLTSPTGVVHWGTLDPVAPAATAHPPQSKDGRHVR